MLCMLLHLQPIRAIVVVKVDSVRCQKITGFGAAAMGHLMSPVTDTAVINYLYGPESPVGLNIMRIEIHPSTKPDHDYTDYDWHGYLPAVKQAKKHGATVFATPWSPPGEYKTNGSGSGGEAEGIKGKLRDDCREKFFPWLNQFLGYMTKNGAPIDIVSIQNEPDWWVSYSGCMYTPQEMQTLVADYGHLLKKERYNVRLMGSESLNHNPEYATALLEDPSCRQYIDIIGGHIYGNRPLYNLKRTAAIAARHGKETWMTEHYTEVDASTVTPWDVELIFAQELNETMLAGANAYVLWYMMGAGGFCGDGRELETYPDNIWGNPLLPRSMVMAHFSKNLIGSTRLETSPEIKPEGESFEYSAYIKGDSLIVMMLNMDARSNTAILELPYHVESGMRIQSTNGNLYRISDITISEPQKRFNLVAPAKSLTTFIYQIECETSAVELIKTDDYNNKDDGYYTPDGLRHDAPVKGVNIYKGKKFIK